MKRVHLIILIGFALLLTAGCSTNITSVTSQTDKSIFPAAADANEMHQYFVGYADSGENPSPAKNAFWDAVEYRIGETTLENDDTGTAKVAIVAPDMAAIMEEAFKRCLAAENTNSTQSELADQLQAEIVKALADSPHLITTNITMGMKKTNGEWMLVPNDEWQQAVLGNAEEIFNKYLQEYLDQVILNEDGGVTQP